MNEGEDIVVVDLLAMTSMLIQKINDYTYNIARDDYDTGTENTTLAIGQKLTY